MSMSVPAEQLPGLIERMIRIEAKLDTYNSNHADHEGRLRLLEERSGKLDVIEGRLQSGVTTFADHESRLRGIERRMWVAAGVAMLGGTLAGAVIGPALGISG
jgi:hypothetical protein